MVDPASHNPATHLASPHRRLRIALAHDWLCGVRGGEHVLERIASLTVREHEPAALFVMFDDKHPIGPAVDSARKVVAQLGERPWSDDLRRWLLPLYPAAVEELSDALAAEHTRHPIDLVISTSSAAIKGLRPPQGVPHLCYCHSPARYIWGQEARYRGGLRGLGLRLVRDRYRAWDRRTSDHVTRFLANSEHTRVEIRRCYGRDAHVVHPPVREMFFESSRVKAVGESRDGPWLVVSALEPYKRVDLAIAAAAQARRDLLVVGGGSQRDLLQSSAPPNIHFLGRVSDERLRELYHEASLLLFPQVEDFGIVAVEAQACGLPVVARAAGGALDIVDDGITGAMFEGDTVASLLRAVERCPHNPAACRANAGRFSERIFDAQIRRHIAELTAATSAASHH